MEFLSLAKRRCSVRSYKDIAVEEEKLNKILDRFSVKQEFTAEIKLFVWEWATSS